MVEDNCEISSSTLMHHTIPDFAPVYSNFVVASTKSDADILEKKLFYSHHRGRRPRWCGQPFLGWLGYL